MSSPDLPSDFSSSTRFFESTVENDEDFSREEGSLVTFEEDAWVKADPGKEFALDEVVDADEMGLREIPSDLARAAYVISIPRSQRPG